MNFARICISAIAGFRPGGAAHSVLNCSGAGGLETLAHRSYRVPGGVAKRKGCSERWEPGHRSDTSGPLTSHRLPGGGCRDQAGQKRRAGSVSHDAHAEGIGQPGQTRRGCSTYAFRSEPHHESPGFKRLDELEKKKGMQKNWREFFAENERKAHVEQQ
jgi:hypothetical protein